MKRAIALFLSAILLLGGAVMNVSTGACGWRMPLRTQAGCHYEVISLLPAE